MAKAKKSKAKKPAKKKAKKTIKRAAAKSRRAPAKARKAKKAGPGKAKKPAPKKKKQIVGEGNYVAAKAFDKDQTDFVKRNKAKIPQMGKDAEKALDGSEGASLRAAEQEAMNRSTID